MNDLHDLLTDGILTHLSPLVWGGSLSRSAILSVIKHSLEKDP